MMTDKYLYIRLFAMKYEIKIVFVVCNYDGKKDMLSGIPTKTMYTLFILDEKGDVINISKPKTSLPNKILQQHHFVVFFHQDYDNDTAKLGPPRKFKLLINKFSSEDLFNNMNNVILSPTTEDIERQKN